MVTEVTRYDVEALMGRGAQIVDVLDAKEYDDSHLPGATTSRSATSPTRHPACSTPPSRPSRIATTRCAT